ncbi:MAG: ATP-binding cassette domain-containing protein [Bacilli bacterium]
MIEIENVSKQIKKKDILKNVTYKFEEGHIYGLYGHNGSGKTMLLRALCGLIIPNSGVVKIDDKILHKDLSFPPSIGIVIENMELLPQFNAFDNLKILSDIKKVATDEDIKSAIIKVGLDPDSKMKVRKFSLGMKQRLNIAQAVFEKPDIILLDEPTNALDEESVKKIYDLLFEEKERGAIIIIASHNKEDLSELCDTTIKVVDGSIDVSNPFIKN